jgi:CRP-like cAMP-binding protein/zinc transporter ZupT
MWNEQRLRDLPGGLQAMTEAGIIHFLWAVLLGALSAVSLPLGSGVGLGVRFSQQTIAVFAAFGAGALIAALSVELVAPTALAVTGHGGGDRSGHAITNLIALLVGGAFGGLLFVLLDAAVNARGGYVRKRSATLARLAARGREEARDAMRGILRTQPFDALPADLAPALAAMLRPVAFGREHVIAVEGPETRSAFIILDGEVEADIAGRPAQRFGPGTVVGLLALFVPGLTGLARIVTKTDVRCVELTRDDADRLCQASPAFERACRDLAGERMDQLEKSLVTRLDETIEWARVAASAVRFGGSVPAFSLLHPREEDHGSALAVWLGILLDGVPESLVIGAGLYLLLVADPAVETLRFVDVIPYTLVAGLFLSNFPEALSSSANMHALGWSRGRILLMWSALTLVTAAGAGLGFVLATILDETWLVFAEGIAAGAMLTMIAAAMIPEAAAHGRPGIVGLSTLGGFLAAVLFKLLE